MSAEKIRFPLTFWFGLGAIAVCEVLLFIDVAGRNWAVAPHAGLAAPEGMLLSLGRSVAIDMTPICWTAYLLMLDGILKAFPSQTANIGSRGSPVRLRPRRFALCFLASIPIWLWFDWINFSFIDAWRYHGLPDSFVHRYLGYFFAFGAICPAMFLTAEFYQRLGAYRLKASPFDIGPTARIVSIIVGAVLLVFPFAIRDPIGSLTMWLAWILLLDPVNDRLGAPSILRDWRAGRYGRTVALLLAGLTCGLLWEFWNYWAVAKWTYHLPFLGVVETYRYFEMPIAGLFGFPPFAIECWVMFQTAAFAVSKLHPRLLEPLPEDASVV